MGADDILVYVVKNVKNKFNKLRLRYLGCSIVKLSLRVFLLENIFTKLKNIVPILICRILKSGKYKHLYNVKLN